MSKMVIVGGGIAGLSAGIYAQASGFDSVVLEKNDLPGGLCTGWDRQGYHIDNCIHWMTGTKPGTALNRIWREVGALSDAVELVQWKEFTQATLDGTTIHVWQDAQKFEQELLQLAPEDEKAIKRLIKGIRGIRPMVEQMPVSKPMDLLSPPALLALGFRTLPSLRRMSQYNGSIRELAGQFTNPTLRQLITMLFPEGEWSASSLLFSLGTFMSGNGAVPAGGSRAMAERMADRYRSLGGKLRLKAEAQQVLEQNGKASGVRLTNGETIAADWTLLACDAAFSYHTLLGGRHNSSVFESLLDDPERYPCPSMFCVAFGADAGCGLPVNSGFACEPFVVGERTIAQLSVKNFSYEPGFAPKGKTVLSCCLSQQESDYEYWALLREHPDAYRAAKQLTAEAVLDRVEAQYPHLKGGLELLDVCTPATYTRYTHAHKGAYMSFIATPKGKRPGTQTGNVEGLSNCLLTGQWMQPPGGLPGAVCTGRFSIQRICKQQGQAFQAPEC